MLIFREIEEMVNEAKSRQPWLESDQDETTAEEQQLRFMMGVVRYASSMEWLSHKKLAAKVLVFLKSGYSFEKVALEFGISVRQARKSMFYAGDKLRSKIRGVLRLIREGRLEEAEREFAMVTGAIDTSSIFAPGILQAFARKSSPEVVLSDCIQEIRFLSAYSRRNFDSLATSLSTEKIGHLLYVLSSSDSASVRERAILWDCIVNGTLSVNECIRALKGDFIWGRLSDSQG